MSKGAYSKSARWYDIVIEPLVGVLRTAGLRMFPPHEGMSVLDIGCGTGTHLNIYRKAGCRSFGIDLSPAMLNVAQKKVGDLTRGDASRMPFPDESFDLVTAMLIFHEMPPALRAPVLAQARRVTKGSGRLLIIDYHRGPVRLPEGWLFKTVITLMENLAGGDHARNYQSFIANRGLEPLLAESGLLVDEKRIVGGGTIGLHLLHPNHL
jgi:ubiquinone/menaquinone biosynthesis C-methylase UbiE